MPDTERIKTAVNKLFKGIFFLITQSKNMSTVYTACHLLRDVLKYQGYLPMGSLPGQDPSPATERMLFFTSAKWMAPTRGSVSSLLINPTVPDRLYQDLSSQLLSK